MQDVRGSLSKRLGAVLATFAITAGALGVLRSAGGTVGLLLGLDNAAVGPTHLQEAVMWLAGAASLALCASVFASRDGA